MSSTLIYETSNLYIQDACIPEFVVGNKTTFFIEALLQNTIVTIEKAETHLHHIKDALYEIVGLVDEKIDGHAFINLGTFKAFMTDNEVLEVGKYFRATVKFQYDLWCYFNTYVNPNSVEYLFYEEIEHTGTIVSITVDTSLYIPIKGSTKGSTKDGVEQKFDTKISQTSCWDDEQTYSNGPLHYLIEVEL